MGAMPIIPERAARRDRSIEPGLTAPQAPPPSDAGNPEPDKGRLFVHDVAITMGAEAAAMGSSLLLTGMISRWTGARPLSEYLLLRRVLSWTLAAAFLGLATGLPRYVALSAGAAKRNEAAYFVAALMCMVPMAILAGGLMVLKRALFAHWFFGSSQEANLVIALALLLMGYSIHRAVYGYYRGLLEMTRANLLEVANVAVLPLLVVLALARSQTIPVMMGLTGVLMTISSAIFALPVLNRLHRPIQLTAHCRELLQYGVPRVPGDFGVAAITAIGPMMAVHFIPLTKVSPLLLGLNILLVVGYAAGPIGIVLLSKLSMMLGRNEHDMVQARLRLLITCVTELSVFACVQLAIFADVVVRAWVGPGFNDQMMVIRVVLLAIPFYLFFMTLRSTIDAATVKPLNMANVMLCLGVYVGLIAAWAELFPLKSLLIGIAGCLLFSQVLLALLTARTFRRFYGLGVPWRQIGPSFAAAMVLGTLAYALRVWQKAPVTLPEAALVEAVLMGLYVLVLMRRGSGWLAYTWHVGVLRQGNWPDAAEESGGTK